MCICGSSTSRGHQPQKLSHLLQCLSIPINNLFPPTVLFTAGIHMGYIRFLQRKADITLQQYRPGHRHPWREPASGGIHRCTTHQPWQLGQTTDYRWRHGLRREPARPCPSPGQVRTKGSRDHCWGGGKCAQTVAGHDKLLEGCIRTWY